MKNTSRLKQRKVDVSKRTQPRIWTTKTYNRLSRFYDAFMKFFFPVGEKGREKIVEKLTSGSVLDVACGTGTLLEMAGKKGLECFGIDLSEGMLAELKRKIPEAEIRRASYYKIPYPEERFDYVVATNALSGDYIDAKKVLMEMIRVCKVGGWIYIAEWPKAEKDTFVERCIVWFARLNEDAPKDYLAIFREMGYEPEVDVLDERYHVYGIRK
ncbi:MAG: class I SAM-dependent methyltransferase [Anaerolineales bacterium]|nr:class I SAM-dependent methyltransferase [Anaerolineales bacterium]